MTDKPAAATESRNERRCSLTAPHGAHSWAEPPTHEVFYCWGEPDIRNPAAASGPESWADGLPPDLVDALRKYGVRCPEEAQRVLGGPRGGCGSVWRGRLLERRYAYVERPSDVRRLRHADAEGGAGRPKPNELT